MSATDIAGSRPRHFLGNVQALRALAALLVVLVHASLPDVGVESILGPADGPWLTPFHYVGLFGVDLFFVISGFIMLVTNWENFGRPWAGPRFFARRAIRIYPPYWLALFPILPILLFAKSHFMVAHVGVKTGYFESLFLLPNPNKFVLTVGWTLVWEMLFYVVFAFLLTLERRFVVTALGVWFALELVCYSTLAGSPNFYVNFASTPLPLEFIFGTVVGLLYVKRAFPAPRLTAAVALITTVALGIIITANHISLQNINDMNRIVLFGVPAMLLVYAAVGLEVRDVFVAPRAVQAVGDGSYAIYLWHLSLLVILRTIIVRLHPAGPLAHAAVLAVTLGAIVVFGMAVYRFFELPVTRFLNAKLPSRPARAAVEKPVIGRAMPEAAAE